MSKLQKILVSKLNLYLKKPAVLCLSVNILVAIGVLLLSSKLPPVVPLFYGKPFGEEQLVSRSFIILPPLIASIFILINMSLGKIVKDKFLQNILLALILGCTLLSTITVIKVILLIGNF